MHRSSVVKEIPTKLGDVPYFLRKWALTRRPSAEEWRGGSLRVLVQRGNSFISANKCVVIVKVSCRTQQLELNSVPLRLAAASDHEWNDKSKSASPFVKTRYRPHSYSRVWRDPKLLSAWIGICHGLWSRITFKLIRSSMVAISFPGMYFVLNIRGSLRDTYMPILNIFQLQGCMCVHYMWIYASVQHQCYWPKTPRAAMLSDQGSHNNVTKESNWLIRRLDWDRTLPDSE